MSDDIKYTPKEIMDVIYEVLSDMGEELNIDIPDSIQLIFERVAKDPLTEETLNTPLHQIEVRALVSCIDEIYREVDGDILTQFAEESAIKCEDCDTVFNYKLPINIEGHIGLVKELDKLVCPKCGGKNILPQEWKG